PPLAASMSSNHGGGQTRGLCRRFHAIGLPRNAPGDTSGGAGSTSRPWSDSRGPGRCTVAFFDGAAVDPLVSAPDPAYSRLDPGRGSGAQATRPGRMPVTMVSHTRAPQDELSRTTSHYELEITTAPSTSPCSASRSRWEATFGFPSMVTRAIM